MVVIDMESAAGWLALPKDMFFRFSIRVREGGRNLRTPYNRRQLEDE